MPFYFQTKTPEIHRAATFGTGSTLAKPACDHGATVGRRVGVGVEVDDLTGLWAGSELQTWYEQIQAEPVATRFKIDPLAPVTFEDCLHDTTSALSANAGFDRIVIHHYTSYFKHWFGQQPRDYLLAQSGGTYASANPAKANLLSDTRPLVGMGSGSMVVDIEASDAIASETGPNSGTFTFTRYGSTASPLTVNFTVSGTATSGTDYAAIGTSVVIPTGKSSVAMTFTPTADATQELSESVVVTLAAHAAYTIGLPAATVNIATDYGIPTWIVAGQSNAEGYAITANPVTGLLPQSTLSSIGRTDLNVTHSNVRMYQGNNSSSAITTSAGQPVAPKDVWHAMLPYEGLVYDWGTGLGNESGQRFGPELAFGYDVQRRLGGEIAIIKYARGSVTLASNANVDAGVYRDYDPSDSRLNHYDKLVTTITNAVSSLPAGDVLRIKGIVWMQGESDANATMAPNYQTNLTELVTALRNQLSTTAASSGGKLVADTTWGNVKFHVGTIAGSGTNSVTVQNAMTAVAAADSNVATVNGTTGITLMTYDDWTDSGIHYDTAGQATLGERFANSAVPTYPITYNGNGNTGGTVPASQTKTYGINLTLESNSGSLVRTGYTFNGWNTAPDGSGIAYAAGGSYCTEAAATLYADWTSTTPGFNMSGISAATTESGGTASFTVRLNTQPTADVTLGLSSGDSTEGIVTPVILTFTAANWNVSQAVTVTGVDDAVIDGNVAYSILTAAATSADANYNNLNPANVTITNNDNDVAGFTLGAISGPTTEAGGTATFSLKLNTQPTADVTIGISSSDITEGTVSPSSLTFTSANWNTPQTATVTGVDDAIQDGNVAYSIVTAAATSADANYNGLNPADVAVTNSDNDNPPPVSSAGIDQSVSVAGASQWTPAQITKAAWFDASDSGSITQSGGIVSQWNDKSGNSRHAVQTTSGYRPTYQSNALNGLPVIDFDGTDDMFNMGGTATSVQNVFAVFNYEGGAAISGWPWIFGSKGSPDIPVIFGGDATTTIGSNLPQKGATNCTVYVNGAVGSSVAPLNSYDIVQASGASVSPSRSNWWIGDGDGNWNGRMAELVVLSSTISTENRQRLEGYLANKWGLTGNLAANHPYKSIAPKVPITVNLDGTVSDPNGDTLTSAWSVVSGPGPVTFGNANAVDTTSTFEVEGSYVLRLTTSDGSSQTYDECVITVNSNTAGFTISAISGNTTEAGGTATFTVKLNTQPTADVTIGISSNDTTEGSVSPASLTFTTANWNTSQTVTVTGANDAIVDGNIAYNIVTAAATSTDTNYSGLNPSDVTVTNTDNDYQLTVSNDGNGTTTPSGAGIQTIGASVPISATANSGYSFVNWTVVSGSATFGNANLASTTVVASSAATIRANFTGNSYTVTLDQQGGAGGSVSVSATYGSAMPAATAPTRTGYIFDGYYTAINGGGIQYYTPSMSSIRNWDMSADSTLYAKWTMNPYTTWSSGTFVTAFTNTTLSANPDGDQLNNLLEFAFGTDPTSPVIGSLAYALNGNVTRTGTPIIENFAATGQPAEFHAVFARRKNHAAAGLTYTVKFSADLTLWTASAATPTLQSGASSPGDMDVVEVPFLTNVPLNAGGSATPKFFRVEVSSN